MTTTDDRLKKSAGESHVNRTAQDRAFTQNRELSDAERIEMFRQQFHRSALPDLPKLPGWHMCWLTTTNNRDSIQSRKLLGYVPVEPADVPGWEYATLKTGEWAGFIGVNEMLAFKLPMSLYEKYMEEAHFNEPLRQEEKLTDVIEFLEQQAKGSNSRLDIGDGNRDLGIKKEAVFGLD